MTIAVPILFIAGLAFYRWLFGAEKAMDEVWSVVCFGLAPVVGLAVLVFLYNLFVAPARIHEEQRTEFQQQVEAVNKQVNEAQAKLDKSEALAEREGDLGRYLAVGRSLYAETVITDEQFNDWKHRLKVWLNDTRDGIVRLCSLAKAEVFLNVHPWAADIMDGKSFNAAHTNMRVIVQAHCDKLAELIQATNSA